MNSILLPTGETISCFQQSETQLIIDEIFNREVYPLQSIGECRQPVIVDVGANIGVFTHYVLSKYPQATIHAIEPVPPIAEVLQHNVALYESRVAAHVCAISGKTGESEITFYPGYSIMSRLEADPQVDEGLLISCVREDLQSKSKFNRTLNDRHVRAAVGDKLANHETYPCKLLTLNDFIRQNNIEVIDYLKLDAEGSEKGILESLDKATWQTIQSIGIEVHEYGAQPRTVTVLDALLNEKGFTTRTGHQTGDGAAHTIMLYGTRAL